MRRKLAGVLLKIMTRDIKNGTTFTEGEYHEGVLDKFVCYFGEVPKKRFQNHVGWAIWFYEGKSFPLLQRVYSTVAGKFPWDKDFPEEVRFHCKLLIEPPKEH